MHIYEKELMKWMGHLLLEDPQAFQGLRVDPCLTLGNELSEETHILTKQKTLLGRGAQTESNKVREPRRTALPRGSQSHFMIMIILLAFQIVSGQSSCSYPYLIWLSILLNSPLAFLARTSQPRWIPVQGFWEFGRTYCGLTSPPSFWPLSNSPG